MATFLDHAGGRVAVRVPEAFAYFAAASSSGAPTAHGPAGSPDRLVADVCRRLRYARDVLQQLTTPSATQQV